MAFVNIIMDYALIFGNWGFPELGIGGAALASVISEAFTTLCFIFYTISNPKYKKFELFHWSRFSISKVKPILNISIPIMIQNFISLSGWLTFFLIVEKTGERPLAISNIIRSIYMIMMIPAFGFYSATHSLISDLLGQDKQNEVIPLIRKLVTLSFVTSLVIAILGVLFPHQILSIYTYDKDLLIATVPSFYIISYALLLMATTMIIFASVSGTGNTQVSLIIEIITITIYLSSAYYLAIILNLSIEKVWYTEFIYLSILGGLSALYLKFGKWQGKEF